MSTVLSVRGLNKIYDSGLKALDDIHLDVRAGEIFALLGPNGAGKTTLISAICGILRVSAGTVTVMGYDTVRDYRRTRAAIGLVPQELATDMFETVWDTVRFSRGLFGKAPNPAYIEKTLRDLSLWNKKDAQIRTLSGGMKRRVMIAKALSHEPEILFLDEPTAGVDVELRKSMWQEVRRLQERGVTIILTTHYLEEAEEMADRIGVINKGRLIVTEEKKTLMKKLGKKELVLDLAEPLSALPESLTALNLSLSGNGQQIIYTYDANKEESGTIDILDKLREHGIRGRDFSTRQSSLEDIFIKLVEES